MTLKKTDDMQSRDQVDGVTNAAPSEEIAVAVLLDTGATIIDFAGPWDAFKAATDKVNFHIFSVAPTKEPTQTMGGLTVLPDYTFEDAPQPKVIVIPAQGGGRDPSKLEWIRGASKTAEHVMSVCTGAFVLARTGLLDDRTATTHHEAYDIFEENFPKVRLQRNVAFVVAGKFSSASAGLAGVDLALHIVSLYQGEVATEAVAMYLGHRSTAWRNQ